MAFIHSIQTDVPKYTLSQLEFYEFVAPNIEDRFHNIFKRILNGSQIKKRHFSINIEEMISMTDNKRVEDKFALWKTTTMEYYSKEIQALLDESGLEADDIDGICTSTTSGFVTPDPTILLMDKFGFRPDIKRLPLFGFGCSGGLAAIHRVNEYLDKYTDKAYLVCVGETLSTQYENATSVSVLVSNSIFGDGFASLLMVGKDHPLAKESQVELDESNTYVFPKCDFAIGQWMTDEGVHTHVDAKLPRLVKSSIKEPLSVLLNESGVSTSDIDYWICHAGGPKVMEAFAEVMDISDSDLGITMDTYRNYGNQSSVSILTALNTTLNTVKKPGLGCLMALGPGIHMEYSLCKVTPRKIDTRTHKKGNVRLSGNTTSKTKGLVEHL